MDKKYKIYTERAEYQFSNNSSAIWVRMQPVDEFEHFYTVFLFWEDKNGNAQSATETSHDLPSAHTSLHLIRVAKKN